MDMSDFRLSFMADIENEEDAERVKVGMGAGGGVGRVGLKCRSMSCVVSKHHGGT
jgi:hypothetical protein